jgi:hypothetical protein
VRERVGTEVVDQDLLREIRHQNDLPAPAKQELTGSIERNERQFFAESDGEPVDLQRIAETWIRRVL